MDGKKKTKDAILTLDEEKGVVEGGERSGFPAPREGKKKEKKRFSLL